MKKLLRIFIFVFISFETAQRVINPFLLDSRSVFLITLALALIALFSEPLFKTLSVAENFITSYLLSSLLNFAVIYALTYFIPGIGVQAADTPNLRILGFMLTSKHLSGLWSLLAYTLVYTLVIRSLNWLCRCRKE